MIRDRTYYRFADGYPGRLKLELVRPAVQMTSVTCRSCPTRCTVATLSRAIDPVRHVAKLHLRSRAPSGQWDHLSVSSAYDAFDQQSLTENDFADHRRLNLTKTYMDGGTFKGTSFRMQEPGRGFRLQNSPINAVGPGDIRSPRLIRSSCSKIGFGSKRLSSRAPRPQSAPRAWRTQSTGSRMPSRLCESHLLRVASKTTNCT